MNIVYEHETGNRSSNRKGTDHTEEKMCIRDRVVSNKSPWLQEAELGATYCCPASHGEGRFVAPKEWIDRLFANGQVATQYCDPDGRVSMDEEWNINGSYASIEGDVYKRQSITGSEIRSYRISLTFPVSSAISVSYTHLDVYKRQVHKSAP